MRGVGTVEWSRTSRQKGQAEATLVFNQVGAEVGDLRRAHDGGRGVMVERTKYAAVAADPAPREGVDLPVLVHPGSRWFALVAMGPR